MSTWAEQKPSGDYYQVLDPDGNVVNEPPDLDDDTLIRMYRILVKTRKFENRTLKLQRSGELNLATASTGEEATPLGSAAALEEGDWIFPSYRQSPASYYWGGRIDRQLAGRMGATAADIEEHLGEPEEKPVNFTPVYVPLATNIPNAAGFAMIDGFEDNDVVTMAYIGDGSTSQGDFHEGLNFAGVFDAPLVTVCQNNQWAISVPAERQTGAETFAQKAVAHGIPHERVDGNDVLAVYEKTKEAVDRARNGGGPGFIECVTYRLAAHNTADEPSKYRDEDKLDYWRERDPIDRFEAYLTDEDVLDDDDVDRIDEEITELVDEAVQTARNIPANPDPMGMFENHLQGEPSWHLKHQMEELEAELNGENPFVDYDGSGL
ncbi:MAG: thiamine pyrophosphate-dependent enzyme [Halobacteriales archaeon]|nr:thiamine pyrophosphate-dependent enzyme [Halobacteriales archaeon]